MCGRQRFLVSSCLNVTSPVTFRLDLSLSISVGVAGWEKCQFNMTYGENSLFYFISMWINKHYTFLAHSNLIMQLCVLNTVDFLL